MDRWFRRLQLLSAAFFSLNHGANDAQKTMGIIAGILFAAGYIPTFDIPFWVVLLAHTAIGLAADIHLSCAMPVARYVEFLTPSPYMDDLVKVPFRPDAEGYLALPEGPGLGIELNPAAMERFRAG